MMPAGENNLTLAGLDARVRELEAVQQLLLRLLSTTKPLNGVLEHYGATDTQERACYRLLDDLAVRATGRERDRPSFSYFHMEMDAIFPALRGDREFIALVIDTLKVERLAYRELHAYMAAGNWPTWP